MTVRARGLDHAVPRKRMAQAILENRRLIDAAAVAELATAAELTEDDCGTRRPPTVSGAVDGVAA